MNRTQRLGRLGGLVAVAVARRGRVGRAGPGLSIAGLALAGVAGCAAATIYYLAEYPSYYRAHPAAVVVSLPPVTAVVLAVVLAGCVWLAVAPPRWLLPDRHARRFGVAMAIALVAGFVLVSRLEQRDMTLDAGIMSYRLLASPAVVLTGSVAAAGGAGTGRRRARAQAGPLSEPWAALVTAPRRGPRPGRPPGSASPSIRR